MSLDPSGSAFKNACSSCISSIDASSSMNTSANSGFSSLRINLSLPRPYSSRRCIVRASRPVVSVMRFAARPVGAHSSTSSPSLSISSSMKLIIVVLPVPGPPVITHSPPPTALSTAARWSGASFMLRASCARASSSSISMYGASKRCFASAASILALSLSSR
ncbi:hypothetical protein SDC9_106491 [bioreactor metagenome]|uniref:Uncharacterized protein n=1 Tax=bioreactor metagenome TaxID=1076179 RepID=A0A645B2I7_9ZZZZ